MMQTLFRVAGATGLVLLVGLVVGSAWLAGGSHTTGMSV
jgi:hypothetical protein